MSVTTDPFDGGMIHFVGPEGGTIWKMRPSTARSATDTSHILGVMAALALIGANDPWGLFGALATAEVKEAVPVWRARKIGDMGNWWVEYSLGGVVNHNLSFGYGHTTFNEFQAKAIAETLNTNPKVRCRECRRWTSGWVPDAPICHDCALAPEPVSRSSVEEVGYSVNVTATPIVPEPETWVPKVGDRVVLSGMVDLYWRGQHGTIIDMTAAHCIVCVDRHSNRLHVYRRELEKEKW